MGVATNLLTMRREYVGVNLLTIHSSCADYIVMGKVITAGERDGYSCINYIDCSCSNNATTIYFIMGFFIFHNFKEFQNFGEHLHRMNLMTGGL